MVYITVRTLIPLREKRPFVICFYIMAALQALCQIADGVFDFSFTSTYMNTNNFSCELSAADSPTKRIAHDMIVNISNAVNLMLLIMIQVITYHLKLTLSFIVLNNDSQDSHKSHQEAVISIESARRKEKLLIIAGVVYCGLYIVTGTIIIIVEYAGYQASGMDFDDYTYVLEVCFLVGLLVSYTYTVIALYQKVKLLENMQEEKNAIIKQVLAFYASLISLLAFKGYYFFLEKESYEQGEYFNYERATFRICWIEVIVCTINKFVPLIYMVLTHMKTYKADK